MPTMEELLTPAEIESAKRSSGKKSDDLSDAFREDRIRSEIDSIITAIDRADAPVEYADWETSGGISADEAERILAENKEEKAAAEEDDGRTAWEREGGINQEEAERILNETRAENLENAGEGSIEKKYEEEFGLKSEDLDKVAGFENLSDGQKLFVLENLRQINLGRVKDDAIEEYSHGFKKMPGKGSGFFKKAATVMGNAWHGAAKSFKVAKAEKMKANELAEGGLKEHGEILERLVGSLQGGPEVKERDGRLEVQFLPSPEQVGSPEGKEIFSRFNDAANDFMRIPQEWAYAPSGKKEKKLYEEAKLRYETARKDALLYKAEFEGETAACVEVNAADAKIQVNQFLNHHPDAEEELLRIKNQNEILKGIMDLGKGKRLSFVAGAAIRSVAVGTIGAIAAPVVGSLIGGWRGQVRAKEKLGDQDRLARRGQEDKSAEAKNFIKAEDLERKLDNMIEEIDRQGVGGNFDLMNRLAARVKYTQGKVEDGLVAFGTNTEALDNQYRLTQKLSQVKTMLEVYKDERNPQGSKLEERLERYLAFIGDKIDDKRKKYITKQIIKGAAIGAGAAAAGWALRNLAGEWFGWDGHGAPAEASAEEVAPAAGAVVAAAAEGDTAAAVGEQEVNNTFFSQGSFFDKYSPVGAAEEGETGIVPPWAPPNEIAEAPVFAADSPEPPVADIPSAETPAPTGEYLGGHSVWQEAENQVKARLGAEGEGAKLLAVDQMKDAIVADPERYGLPADIDFNKMEVDDLKGINWDKAFEETMSGQKVSAEDLPASSPEDLTAPATEEITSLHQALGGTREEAPSFAEAFEPEPTPADQAREFLNASGTEERLKQFSKLLNDRENRFNPIARMRADRALAELRGQISDETGGTLTVGHGNDLYLKFDDGSSFQVYDNEAGRLVEAPLASLPDAAPVGFRPEIFAKLDRNPMGEFPQKTFGFGPGIEDAQMEQLHNQFHDLLAEREAFIKLEDEWDLKYGDDPKYQEFAKAVRRLVAKENGKLEDIIKMAAGEKDLPEALGAINPVSPEERADKVLRTLAVSYGIKDAAEADFVPEIKPVVEEAPVEAKTVAERVAEENLNMVNDDFSKIEKIAPRDLEKICHDWRHENLSFRSLKEVDPKMAKAMLKHDGFMDLSGVKRLDHETLEILKNKKGVLDLSGLENISLADYETLSKFKAECLFDGKAKELMDAFASAEL